MPDSCESFSERSGRTHTGRRHAHTSRSIVAPTATVGDSSSRQRKLGSRQLLGILEAGVRMNDLVGLFRYSLHRTRPLSTVSSERKLAVGNDESTCSRRTRTAVRGSGIRPYGHESPATLFAEDRPRASDKHCAAHRKSTTSDPGTHTPTVFAIRSRFISQARLDTHTQPSIERTARHQEESQPDSLSTPADSTAAASDGTSSAAIPVGSHSPHMA